MPTFPELVMSVHNDSRYLNYEFKMNTVSWCVLGLSACVFLGLICFIRMAIIYCSQPSMATKAIHPHVFKSMVIMQLSHYIFFITDNLAFRVPSTGFVTASCAAMEPNHYLKIIYLSQMWGTYWSMFSSLLFSIIRMIVYVTPTRHAEWSSYVFYTFIPLAFFSPFGITYFMYPAKGYCRQWGSPLGFGSVFISYTETYDEIRHDIFFIPLTLAVPLLIIINNFALIVMAVGYSKTLKRGQSLFKQSSQLSLILTSIAMTVPYITSGILTAVVISYPDVNAYVLFIRSPITDIAQSSIPIIFYLTHPLFRKKIQKVYVANVIPSTYRSNLHS
ncbi:Serpentine Receptor, class T [Caenorhabditis elegans]|uniref:Serpentine Receptor, class T n=1 Tax=Caenorhabditis elegans TaxID=6239 RepID=Q22124_CAEEL|nr:Serpentine Receptor, class T [Caenorhabditis elegans]CCD68812.1 Serpentine Receptor, class T [Caenorhabditis elegans]|eukprot:NP_508881.2 Serpentine Receptor, class U [Caenorhabditis elegans]